MDKTKLTAGVFILLAVIGTTYYISQDDNAYFCEDTNVVGLCWKLSKVNAAGTQTRCYYNESESTRYKNCKTGWTSFKDNFTGTIIDEATGFDIDLSQDKIDVLMGKGIGKKEIRNQTCINFNETSLECLERDNTLLGYDEPIISPCIKLDEFNCRANIYQKRGINKDIEIIYHFCGAYVFNVTLNETTNECETWKILSQEEIETKILTKTKNLLNKIVSIYNKRQLELNQTLTRKINLNIN